MENHLIKAFSVSFLVMGIVTFALSMLGIPAAVALFLGCGVMVAIFITCLQINTRKEIIKVNKIADNNIDTQYVKEYDTPYDH